MLLSYLSRQWSWHCQLQLGEQMIEKDYSPMAKVVVEGVTIMIREKLNNE
jgi:hypothetical protein